MKTILHVDMNAFFASVEQAANPKLKGKPIAVGGGIKKGSVVAAASYEAKAHGVKNGMSTWEAKKLCPNLIVIIGDMTKYIHASKTIFEILYEYTDLVDIFSIDEAFMDITKTKDHFGGEITLAKDIKKRIKEKLNLTCSIGISYNKLMAKLAGELKKPDGLVTLNPKDIPDKIKDVPVSKLCGIGRKTEEKLKTIKIKTFEELNRYPREKLVKIFGIFYGEQLYQMGQGCGEVRKTETSKSMGHSYTLPKFTNDINEINGYLLRLAEQVGRRLRKHKYRGRAIHLTLGFGNYKFFGKQKKIEDYIDDGYKIYKIATKLFPDYLNQPIRLVGVSVSNLIQNQDQVSLFESEENKKEALRAADEINNRYGEFTIERASIMTTKLRGKTGMISPRLYRLNKQ